MGLADILQATLRSGQKAASSLAGEIKVVCDYLALSAYPNLTSNPENLAFSGSFKRHRSVRC